MEKQRKRNLFEKIISTISLGNIERKILGMDFEQIICENFINCGMNQRDLIGSFFYFSIIMLARRNTPILKTEIAYFISICREDEFRKLHLKNKDKD